MITCLIQIGILLSLKYFAKLSSCALERPTKSLHFSLFICFISNNTKSVKESSSSTLGLIGTIPDVSIAV